MNKPKTKEECCGCPDKMEECRGECMCHHTKEEWRDRFDEEFPYHWTEYTKTDVMGKFKESRINKIEEIKSFIESLLAQQRQEDYEKIDKAIGNYYEFEGMCEWAREEDPAPPFCIHENCHKAQGINMTQGRIRREIKNMLI